MKRDFAQLYSQLDLLPDCTLEEFKRAYRRRIAELHPDKVADVDAAESLALLPDIIGLYTTATRFHRRHGRLPGARASLSPRARAIALAPPSQPNPNKLAAPQASATRAFGHQSSASAAANDGGHTARPGPLLAAALVVLAVILAFSWDWPEPAADESVPGEARVDPDAAAIAAKTHRLEPGMDEATVLAIQGKPLQVNGDRWDYGPSWLQFEQGRLVDWHSSPLHSLKTDTAAAPPETTAH